MLRRIVAGVVLVATMAVSTRGVGPVPALGSFLDPVHGVWGVAATATLPRSARDRIPGLRAPVDVRYDQRGVPHIFATSEEDADRALGYVVARDRLFQLELQARAGAGTLTELAGPIALGRDREMRQLGLPRAAQRAMAALDSASTSPTTRAAYAYADGVNAWIDAMPAAALPLEYRLLGKRPARWMPINTLYLLSYMSWVLGANDEELKRADAAALVGRRAADALFPVHAYVQEPIVPTRRRTPYVIDAPFPPPGAPDTSAVPMAHVLGAADLRAAREPPVHDTADAPVVGSNNWAVSPRRTAAGHALLAGDPHLDLSLPSIWYEAHLVVPDALDVQGVTIPGAPVIIIGFNRDVAWTFTDAEADALDHYAEVVDHTDYPTQYRLDRAWRRLEPHVERYLGPRGELLAVDTLWDTHRGPLQKVGDRWLSMRWTALEPSRTINAFHDIAYARSVAEFEQAMAQSFVPALNTLVADRSGSIAIRTTGHFPIRAGDGVGTEIRDGTTSRSDWRGYLPLASYPHAVDPAQGFLASTNQEPFDPSSIHGRDIPYLGSDWPGQWRAMRINALLRADSAVTPDAMRQFQIDRGSARADYFVPFLLHAARHADSTGHGTPSMRDAARRLGAWDRRYAPDDTGGGAALFEAAMTAVADHVWSRLSPVAGRPRVATPTSATLAALVREPRNPWWDDPRTPGVVESRDDVLAASLAAGYDALVRDHGAPSGGGWRWDRVRQQNIYHAFRARSLSRLGLTPPGGPHTLSPTTEDGVHGASWRMVVELGPRVRAWATYPGGQSGNPVSPRYADRLPQWLAGGLDTVATPAHPADLRAREISASLRLEPVP